MECGKRTVRNHPVGADGSACEESGPPCPKVAEDDTDTHCGSLCSDFIVFVGLTKVLLHYICNLLYNMVGADTQNIYLNY